MKHDSKEGPICRNETSALHRAFGNFSIIPSFCQHVQKTKTVELHGE